jgi:hypothetical protein
MRHVRDRSPRSSRCLRQLFRRAGRRRPRRSGRRPTPAMKTVESAGQSRRHSCWRATRGRYVLAARPRCSD